MRRPSRSPKASDPRPKPKVQYPARYSHDYPIHGGHDYLLNSIPPEIWERAKKRAHAEERSVRVVLIRALDLFGSGRIDI